MNHHKDQNVVKAHKAANRAKVQFWLITLVAMLLLAGIGIYYSYDGPGAQTTADDGRKLQSPEGATSGSAQ
jgi:hypothetical protein